MEAYVEEIENPPAPVQALERLSALPYPLLLESAAPQPETGRFSYLMADPFEVLIARVEDGGADEHPDPLGRVRAALDRFPRNTIPGLPPFQGGAAGYFGYDLGRTLERIPPHPVDDLGLPDLVLGLYDCTLAWDHQAERCWLISTGVPATGEGRHRRARERAAAMLALLRREGEEARDRPAAAWRQGKYSEGDREAARPRAVDPDTVRGPLAPAGAVLADAARSGTDHPGRSATEPLRSELLPPVSGDPVPGLPGVFSGTSRAEYLRAVERIRRYIVDGDIFQANLSQRLHAPAPVDPVTLYTRLRERSPAPYAAFFDTGEAALVSASPELFLRLHGRQVETRPIKGTSPRFADPADDARSAEQLAESEKDRAENVMIVDLLRNDLSRVCTDPSVRVPRLCAVESHGPVHHLVSTVTGELRPGCDAIDLLRAAFPGGSITGAPKIRAMEIIAELEATRRGPYTGSIGFIGFDGSMETSIVIRSFVVKDGTAYFQVGGGIVADSDPAREYEETLHKAAALAAVVEVTG
jgi:para-aminobenzoate synthetase component I